MACSAALAACGGGDAGDRNPGVAAPRNETVVATTSRDPYWLNPAEVRPNLAHLLKAGAAGGSVIQLRADEQALVNRARAQGLARAQGAAVSESLQAQTQAVAVQRRTVTGLSSTIFHTAAGSEQQPNDLSGSAIEAFAPDGSGGFERIAATARRSDGTYAIAGVPEGPHWVRLGLTYVWTDSAFIDWSQDAFGRADVFGYSQPTTLQVDAGNLSPWQADDSLHWVVPMQGASFAIPLDSSAVTNPPRPADAALAAFGLDLGSTEAFFGGPLESAKGDQLYLNQLVDQGGSGLRTLARSLVAPPLNTPDGSTTHLQSGFLDVAASARLALRFNRSAYLQYAAAVNPAATLSNTLLGVSAFAMAPEFGTTSDAFTLIEFDKTGSTDLDFGSVRYGQPFPADWNRALDATVAFTVRYLAPGATVAEPLLRGISSSELLDPGARDNTRAVVSPRLTPPRSPLINGKSLFDNQLAVGGSPTLSWSAPAKGQATYYFVRVLELSADGTRSQLRTRARLLTGATTLTVPPGLLEPGHLYVITIAAQSSGTPVTAPFKRSFPFSFATLTSGIVSP